MHRTSSGPGSGSGNDTGYRVTGTGTGPGAGSYHEGAGAPVRGSTDVMAAVVGEVEAALKTLERERNTESVRDKWLLITSSSFI